jgi:environmental stress-induced protein Ves
LLDGPIRNFNLIYRPDRVRATVQRLTIDRQTMVPARQPETRLLFLAQAPGGGATGRRAGVMARQGGASARLQPGDSLLLAAGGPSPDSLRLACRGLATALLVTLEQSA